MDGVGDLTARARPLVDTTGLLGDPAALRRAADADGCLFLPGLVPAGAVEALRGVVLEACRARGFLAKDAPPGDAAARPGVGLGGPDDARWIAFLADVLPREEFRSLGRHAALLRVLEILMPGGFVAGRGDVCRLVSPDARDHMTAPHQDRSYVPGSGPLWTAWLPVVDCPRSVGPLAVLPGSHRLGLLPHAGDGAGRRGIALPAGMVLAASDLAPGDVLFFSGLTVHGALPNVSPDRLRISVDYRFEGAPA